MRYIEDVVQGYLKEHKEQENIHDIVERALEQRKNLNLEEKDGILLEVDTQNENYAKVLTYIGFLLD